MKDTLGKVDGIHAIIINHANEILCEANEVEFHLSMPANDDADVEIQRNKTNARTVLIQLSILRKHHERAKETVLFHLIYLH